MCAIIKPTAQSRRIAHSQKVARRIGQQLLQEKKKALQAQATAEKRGVKRDDLQGRDLLSLLIKANMATDVPDNQRLSDEDVLARMYYTFSTSDHLINLVSQRYPREALLSLALKLKPLLINLQVFDRWT